LFLNELEFWHIPCGVAAGDMSEDDQQALKEIAEFFEQPNKDLQTLMDKYFPDANFKGFTCALAFCSLFLSLRLRRLLSSELRQVCSCVMFRRS
jgi:hypothetical protein